MWTLLSSTWTLRQHIFIVWTIGSFLSLLLLYLPFSLGQEVWCKTHCLQVGNWALNSIFYTLAMWSGVSHLPLLSVSFVLRKNTEVDFLALSCYPNYSFTCGFMVHRSVIDVRVSVYKGKENKRGRWRDWQIHLLFFLNVTLNFFPKENPNSHSFIDYLLFIVLWNVFPLESFQKGSIQATNCA